MEKIVLHATPRTVTGKQVGVLRREGKLPAVIYGHNFEAMPIVLDLRETTRSLHGSTASTIVMVDINGKEHAVLVREKQRDYLRGTLLHVDFLVVSLTEKIHASVGIEITGLAPAVKDFNGVIVTGTSKVDVEALPQYLPERYTIDISSLANIGDGFYVRDLPVLENVVIHADPDEMVVLVTHEGAAEPTEEVVAAEAEPEVLERGKKEEDEEK